MLLDSQVLLAQHAKLDIQTTVLIARLATTKFKMDTAFLALMSALIALNAIMVRLVLSVHWAMKILNAVPASLDILHHLLLHLPVLPAQPL